MKQTFFLMLAALLSANGMSAQSTTDGIKGDLNGDNRRDIGDVMTLLDLIASDNGTLPTGGTQTFTVNGVDFTMVRIEGSTFQMGATEEQGTDAMDEEMPVHAVTLSSFSMGQTEVTQQLWQAVMGQTPTAEGTQWSTTLGLGDGYPVYYVSWDDCQKFIARLNQLTGRRFRLPTEAEWEYAARGGSQGKGYKFAGGDTVNDVAWYKDNSANKTHEVATRQPNELGLYDMSGNVAEWCADWFNASYYASSPAVAPTGPESGKNHVRRGGAWRNVERVCRVSSRGSEVTTERNNSLGLRLAM